MDSYSRNGVGGQFHVEAGRLIKMAEDEIRVHHLNIARDRDHPGGDGDRSGCGKLQPLGAFTLHAQRDLLHVQNKVGDVFADAREATELMQDILDLEINATSPISQKNLSQCVVSLQFWANCPLTPPPPQLYSLVEGTFRV